MYTTYKSTVTGFAFAILATIILATREAEAEGLDIFAIGGKVGYASPENLGGTFELGVHADLGEVTKNLVLFPEITFWTKSHSSNGGDLFVFTDENGNLVQYKMKFQQIGLSINAHYYLNPEAKSNLYIGGGSGLFNHRSSFDIFSVSTTDIGVNLLGGVETPISKSTSLIAELKYTVVKDFSTIGLNIGLSANL